MRYQGKVCQWNDERGFGFVEPNGGGDKAFVHIKAFVRSGRRPVNGDVIVYDAIKEKDGKYKAANIVFAQEIKKDIKSKKQVSNVDLFFVMVFCVFIALSALLNTIHWIVPVFYCLVSFFTFMMYAADKSAAKNNRWRTKESTLHLLSVIGGWPGALFAQKKLRHKSKKTEFQVIFWITVLINLGFTYYFFTAEGDYWIRHLVGF